jgi:hypothetical protein
LEGFLSGFRDFANGRDLEALEAADGSPRSFGGNVYLSLSGHGAGFWDSSETAAMQPLLEEYSGGKYRFEGIALSFREDGKLDLASFMERLEDNGEYFPCNSSTGRFLDMTDPRQVDKCKL